ncbi:DMT family transporter [Membranihabitans marinus]
MSASAFIVMRWAAPDIAPGPFALLRLVTASAVLSILLLVLRQRPIRPSPRVLLLTLTFGVLSFALYTLVFNWAGHFLDAGTVALIINFSPLMIGLGAVFFLGEAFSRRLFSGILTALLGIILIAVAGSLGHVAIVGLVLSFLAAVLYSAGVLVQKVVLRSIDPLATMWIGCLAATAALLPFTPQAVTAITAAPLSTILGAVYLGAGPTALGYLFWGYAMNHFSTGQLASSNLAVPALVVAASAMLLGETPPVLAIIGGAICLAGVGITQLRRPPQRLQE